MRTAILLLAMVLIFPSCENDDVVDPQSVTDVDGNVYRTTTIGTQVWMAENLKVTRDSDGQAINNSIPNNDIGALNTYGRLYDWESALKVCPKGWHLPNKDEWFVLLSHMDKNLTDPNAEGFVGEETGGALKSTSLWSPPNSGATNSTGFSALPSGFFQNGNLYMVTFTTNFWSATSGNDDQAYGGVNVIYDSPSVFRGYNNKLDGHCVRCLKD